MANNYGPRQRQPRAPTGVQMPINQAEYQQSFDKDAFQNFIRGQGIKLIHFRAIPDPTAMASRGDNHAVSGVRSSSDGYIYKEAGELNALFTNNGTDQNLVTEGIITSSSAYITLPEFYDNGTSPVLISVWDRFYIKDIELRVVTSQLLEYNPSGTDRLNWPATAVEHVIDSSGLEYKEGQDFVIDTKGNINWTGQNRPGISPVTGKGVVYSIRYRYTPFFIANRLLHEIRVSQVTDPATYERKIERMPYQVHVIRENVFLDRNHDPDALPANDPRYQAAPRSGGMQGPSG